VRHSQKRGQTNIETEKDGLSDRARLIDKQIYRGKVTQIETEPDRAQETEKRGQELVLYKHKIGFNKLLSPNH